MNYFDKLNKLTERQLLQYKAFVLNEINERKQLIKCIDEVLLKKNSHKDV